MNDESTPNDPNAPHPRAAPARPVLSLAAKRTAPDAPQSPNPDPHARCWRPPKALRARLNAAVTAGGWKAFVFRVTCSALRNHERRAEHGGATEDLRIVSLPPGTGARLAAVTAATGLDSPSEWVEAALLRALERAESES